jgi:hypothetical protein
MDWDHPSWLKGTVYDAIWIWNPQLGNYAAYGSEAGVNNGSNIIPQGQSFFVKAKASYVNLATAAEVACHDNTAFYKNLLQVQSQLRIKASGNNYTDESVIRFKNDALDGEDEKDVAKVNGNPNAPQLSTWVDGKLFSINTLSIGNTQAEVPLHFESDLTGAVKLDFSQMESFPSTTSIRLFDKNTNQSVNIKDQPSYTFTHEPGLNAERFSIVFGQANAMEETNNQGIKLWITDGKLYINAPEHIGQDALVEIYSSTGQIIESQQIVLSTLNTHQLRSKGLVIARLIANNRVATISGIVL